MRELSDLELQMVAGGKDDDPPPKYGPGQLLWVGYNLTKNYVGIRVEYPEFYVKGAGWRYLVMNEYGCKENFYLETERCVKTYKPKKWES